MFEWDENKRRSNLAKHGIDFLAACTVFDGRAAYTFATPRPEEPRWATVGLVEGRCITVVWTPRGHRKRLISARRSRDEEKKH
jgi:uncharacterized DUF497 family protein